MKQYIEIELDDDQIEDIISNNINQSHIKNFLNNNQKTINEGYFDEELNWANYFKLPKELNTNLFKNISIVQLEKLIYFIKHIDHIKYENLTDIVTINDPGQEIL